MQINATNNSAPLPSSQRRVAGPERDRPDAVDFDESTALAYKLSVTDEARPDAVERAKALIAQPDYPPDVAIRGIANLIASKVFTGESSGDE